MNRFIVRLKCNINDDIERYLENKGVNITYKDGLLDDLIIVTTELNKEAINKLRYIEEAKEPRIGSFNDEYMSIN